MSTALLLSFGGMVAAFVWILIQKIERRKRIEALNRKLKLDMKIRLQVAIEMIEDEKRENRRQQ